MHIKREAIPKPAPVHILIWSPQTHKLNYSCLENVTACTLDCFIQLSLSRSVSLFPFLSYSRWCTCVGAASAPRKSIPILRTWSAHRPPADRTCTLPTELFPRGVTWKEVRSGDAPDEKKRGKDGRRRSSFARVGSKQQNKIVANGVYGEHRLQMTPRSSVERKITSSSENLKSLERRTSCMWSTFGLLEGERTRRRPPVLFRLWFLWRDDVEKHLVKDQGRCLHWMVKAKPHFKGGWRDRTCCDLKQLFEANWSCDPCASHPLSRGSFFSTSHFLNHVKCFHDYLVVIFLHFFVTFRFFAVVSGFYNFIKESESKREAIVFSSHTQCDVLFS